MKFENWKIQTLTGILPGEFFGLIQKNAGHIRKSFPLTLLGCADLETTTAFLATAMATESRKEGYYFYIRNLDDNQLIGYVSIKNINLRLQKCELAYFVDADFEGMGIITQAVSKTLEFCFGELEMNKVFICTSEENAASQKIALKHGFSKEGILREEFKNGDGNFEDVFYFGLLKSDFNER